MSLFPHAACLQMEIRSGSKPEDGVKRLRNLLARQSLPKDALVVLPELWATGFDHPRAVELSAGTPMVLAELQQEAAERNLWLAGSLLEPQEQGKPCNTLYLVGPDGVAGKYQKQHLFGFWQEDRHLQAGRRPLPIKTPFGPLGAMICYDLRFPEISRGQVFAGSRLLAVSAQWPLVRLDQWRLLVRARAVESQAFVAACNGCGRIREGHLAGHSMLVDPSGHVLAEAGEEEELVQSQLDEAGLEALRSRFCPGGERPWPGQDQRKIVSLEELQGQLLLIRQQKSRIVFTNGCFDLLHAGHVDYLEQARSCGDCLVVGLNADSSVRALKGPSRPVSREEDRARVLAALGCVDFVVLFAEATPGRLIAALRPDVLVKGADWPEEQIVGAAEVKAGGGEVRRIPFSRQCSTSGIIERILAARPPSS